MPRFCAAGTPGFASTRPSVSWPATSRANVVEIAAGLLDVRFLQRDVEQRAGVADAGGAAGHRASRSCAV